MYNQRRSRTVMGQWSKHYRSTFTQGPLHCYSSHIAQDDKESKVSSSLPFILVDDPGENFGDLLNNLPKLVMESRSESTANKYCSYWVRWKLFIENRGHSPLPAKGIHVALFLVYLLEQKFSSNSILSFVYSIKWVHKLSGFTDPTVHVHVLNLIETSKRIARKPTCKKDHIPPEIVNNMFLKYGSSSDPLVVRDLCMIILSYSCFLRYNELSNLKCSDVTFFDYYFSICITKSKTDQYRSGNEVVCAKINALSCPYKALCKYIKQNDINIHSGDYLFKPMFRSGIQCKLIGKNKKLSYTRTKEVLVSRIKEFNSAGNYGLHSFRAGGASAAANQNVLDRCWKRHGRWFSEKFKDGYVADSLTHRLSVTNNLGLK